MTYWRAIETPFDEIRRGAIWPLIPLALAGGIMLGVELPLQARDFSYGFWPLVFLLVAGFLSMRGRLWNYAMVCIVFGLGFLRMGAQYADNPTMPMKFRYYGAIEGRVIEIDQSSSAALRLTLSEVVLEGQVMTGNVRVSLHGDYDRALIFPGSRIQTTGHLGPPSGPTEPNGFDFRRKAWMEHLVAVGYTINPTIASAPQDLTIADHLLTWRLEKAAKYRQLLGDKIGGIAAALFIGLQSEVDQKLLDAMRASSLAHLLAISGMNIGTVSGLIFLLSKRGLSLIPRFSDNSASLRISALLAIMAGLFYWGISGMSFSATRAVIMVILFFGAIFFMRKAMSMRAICFGASLILIWQPSSLGDVGFQMSFAATAALVFFFSHFSFQSLPVPKLIKWILMLAMTSVIAGAATTPISAYYFHTSAKYGLLANLLAVPIMDFVVMPAGILTAIAEPFGMEKYPLWIAGKGIAWINFVGEWVAGFDHPLWHIGQTKPWVYQLILVSGLLAIIGGFRMRIFCIVMVMVAIANWHQERPMLFVADDAKFFGLKINGPRQFSRATGHAFDAENWALADGDIFNQEQNTIKTSSDPMIIALPKNWRLVFTTTKKGAVKIEAECARGTLIIAAQAQKPQGECVFYDDKQVTKAGGMTFHIKNGELIMTPNINPKAEIWERLNER